MNYLAPRLPMKAAVWLEEARVLAESAPCLRRQVGCVIVGPLATGSGYNRMEPEDRPGCLDGACPRGLQPYERVPAFSDYSAAAGLGECHAVHAEAVALRDYVAAGFDPRDAMAVITCEPCPGCATLLAEAGITEIYTPDGRWAP